MRNLLDIGFIVSVIFFTLVAFAAQVEVTTKLLDILK